MQVPPPQPNKRRKQMILNTTNESFIALVQRVRKGKTGDYHIAVIPTVAGFSARVIDCREWQSNRLEIVASFVHEDARLAARFAADMTTHVAEDATIALLQVYKDQYRWIHFPLVASTNREQIYEVFSRI